VRESEEEETAPTQEEIDSELLHDTEDPCSSSRLRMNIALPKATTFLQEEEDVELVAIAEGD
jgi:hypothetical protein